MDLFRYNSDFAGPIDGLGGQNAIFLEPRRFDYIYVGEILCGAEKPEQQNTTKRRALSNCNAAPYGRQ